MMPSAEVVIGAVRNDLVYLSLISCAAFKNMINGLFGLKIEGMNLQNSVIFICYVVLYDSDIWGKGQEHSLTFAPAHEGIWFIAKYFNATRKV